MTERFSIRKKSELFDKAHSMHDCTFAATYEGNILMLSFNHLEKYCDPVLDTPLYDNFKKLTIKYHGIDCLTLGMRFGKKEKTFYDTVSPLDNKELVMHKYSVDSFNVVQLHFCIFMRKKLWGGTIEISPTEIEYVWE